MFGMNVSALVPSSLFVTPSLARRNNHVAWVGQFGSESETGGGEREGRTNAAAFIKFIIQCNGGRQVNVSSKGVRISFSDIAPVIRICVTSKNFQRVLSISVMSL